MEQYPGGSRTENAQSQTLSRRQAPSLLRLLHDAAYDREVYHALLFGTQAVLEGLISTYLPDATEQERAMLLKANSVAKKWAEESKGKHGRPSDEQTDIYQREMDAIGKKLLLELHHEVFSLIW